ncbi:type II secretion system F family protein [Streptomyces sp. NPDC006622]|uniref:type II secretion system F family protein n=1 Tax=Streptomyces sp. NPDC006622 TaxID=3155459 RepID=UPI0033A6D54A
MSAEIVHRLGVVLGSVMALGWAVRWLDTVRRRRRARQRLAEVLAGPAKAEITRPRARAVVRRWLPEVTVLAAGWTVGGGFVGLVLGLTGMAALWWWRRRRRATDSMSEADARAAARQLPLAADLLAACIAAGAGPVIAAQAVGEALDGPVGGALARGAAEVRLGGEPAGAWRALAAVPGAAALARLLERAGVSGLPAAVPVARIAADARADWARAGTARARRAAVMVTAPVGLCFLPAFIAVGIVPVVIGLAGGVLGGGGP